MMNILNGGAHSDAPIDFQEFMIMPIGALVFPEALRYGAEVFHALKSVLTRARTLDRVGDEGGFAPKLTSAEMRSNHRPAVEKAGYKMEEDIFIALDPPLPSSTTRSKTPTSSRNPTARSVPPRNG